MAEYIERESAIDAIMAVYVGTAGYKARERVFAAEEAVHRLPVADVVPVRHGHWIEEGDCQICSECGEEHCWGEYRSAYCDSCGAKMDGKDGDDNAVD
nr:MAG TPA: TFIIB zinc-binding [Caudoviricetes sp.]